MSLAYSVRSGELIGQLVNVSPSAVIPGYSVRVEPSLVVILSRGSYVLLPSESVRIVESD